MADWELMRQSTLGGARDEFVTPAPEHYVDEVEAVEALFEIGLTSIEVDTTLTVAIQTSARRDDEAFVDLAALEVTSADMPLFTHVAARVGQTVPPMRFFRFAISGDQDDWMATGRITGIFR